MSVGNGVVSRIIVASIVGVSVGCGSKIGVAVAKGVRVGMIGNGVIVAVRVGDSAESGVFVGITVEVEMGCSVAIFVG